MVQFQRKTLSAIFTMPSGETIACTTQDRIEKTVADMGDQFTLIQNSQDLESVFEYLALPAADRSDYGCLFVAVQVCRCSVK